MKPSPSLPPGQPASKERNETKKGLIDATSPERHKKEEKTRLSNSRCASLASQAQGEETKYGRWQMDGVTGAGYQSHTSHASALGRRRWAVVIWCRWSLGYTVVE